MPVRNSIEEMCPSPVARRLRMKRSSPSARPDWSGCGDDRGIEERGGFERVFAGEKRADVELAGLGERAAAEDVAFTRSKFRRQTARRSGWRSPKSASHGGELLLDLGFAEGQGAADDVHDARRIGRE